MPPWGISVIPNTMFWAQMFRVDLSETQEPLVIGPSLQIKFRGRAAADYPRTCGSGQEALDDFLLRSRVIVLHILSDKKAHKVVRNRVSIGCGSAFLQ
jgi:hypothetical protein